MIEKLSEYEISSRDAGAFINVECNTKIMNTLVQKINELVDIVNSIASVQEKLIYRGPADPYAEQRKWIGKLCRFWDEDYECYTYDILKDIDDSYYNSDYPYKISDASFKHCEPVSEDLTYKGVDR